jgi:hypothetical protein
VADAEKAVRDRLIEATPMVNRRVWYHALPQDPKLPALTLQEISAVPESVMGIDTGHVRARVQVDAWAFDRAGAKAVGEAVRSALQRYVGLHEGTTLTFIGMNSAGVRYESEGRVWRHRQDFELWHTEDVT